VGIANQVDDRVREGPILPGGALDRALLRPEGEPPVNLHRLRSRLNLRLARLVAVLGLTCALWACNAPFIPVPPPGQTMFTAELVSDGAGGQKTVWITSGGPDEHAALARFFVFDENRSAGVIAVALPDGSYQAPPMDGALGDHVQIFYETPKSERSQQICVVLQSGTATRCPP
jgi:hypothetical protein